MSQDPYFGNRTAEELAGSARETAEDVARTARDRAAAAKSAAANGLDSAASYARDKADSLPGGPRVRQFAHDAADTLGSTAGYVRDRDLQGMMSDAEAMVKRNPGPALLAAAAVGFMLGRTLSRE